ncbi:hypothetical protein Vqi01_47740 [Micromonospora qiuiae]|uniref:Secreted protein n=1 Tax=Micromonospora qiuiae TaxID=502268 RepID=A0ABQ4JGG9_9ACTN|nr:hypothetical protein Vqi01_47740 [Micromonospora qiuiae]
MTAVALTVTFLPLRSSVVRVSVLLAATAGAPAPSRMAGTSAAAAILVVTLRRVRNDGPRLDLARVGRENNSTIPMGGG